MASFMQLLNRLLAILACSAVLIHAQTTVSISTTFECEQPSALQDGWLPLEPVAGNQRTGVDFLGNGDWIRYDSVCFADGTYDSVAFYNVGWGFENANHRARLKLDNLNGPDLAVFNLNTHSWQYQPPIQRLSQTLTGYHTLYLTFEGGDTVCNRADKMTFYGRATVNSSDALTYYVAPYGDDGNSGLTIDRPFRTIQRAANAMKPGSVCNIRQGIYRETVRPRYSGLPGYPMTFQAYANERVVISGADSVKGWTRHTGNIYKARIGWTMGQYKDQLLVNGNTCIPARIPNVDDPYQPPADWYTMYPTGVYNWNRWIRSGEIHPFLAPSRIFIWNASSDSIKSAGMFSGAMQEYTNQGVTPACVLNLPTNYLVGGLLTIQNHWWLHSSVIASSSGRNSDGITGTNFTSRLYYESSNNWSSGPGWISHLLQLLDQPNEWYRDDTMAYVWTPDGADPSGQLVEAKRRTLGFDLTNKSYTTLKGLWFLATSATLERSYYSTIDDCHFKYPAYADAIRQHEEFSGNDWFNSPYDPSTGFSGVYLGGGYNVIKNSSVQVSARSGIILGGKHNTASNNIVHDICWLPTYDAGIRAYKRDRTNDPANKENGGGHVIEYNTIYNCGRSNVEIDYGPYDPNIESERINIAHNILGRCGWIASEVTSIGAHAVGRVEISYNIFRDIGAIGCAGQDIAFGCWGFRMHHCLMYKGRPMNEGPNSDPYCYLFSPEKDDVTTKVYNNTIIDSVQNAHKDWDQWALAQTGSVMNNIYAWSDTTPWKFTDPVNRDYTLRAGSPAIDAGVPVPGIYNSPDGKPDLGCFEYGQPAWTAGATWQEKPWIYPVTPAHAAGLLSAQVSALYVPRLLIRDQRLMITAPVGHACTVRLFDALGHVRVKSDIRKGGAWQMNATVLPPGMYFVRVSSKAGTTTARVPLWR